MSFDTLSEEAFALVIAAQAEAALEAQFFNQINGAADEHGRAKQADAIQAAQVREAEKFEGVARKKLAHDDRERKKQNRRFRLIAGISSTASIVPVSSLAILLDMVSPNAGAAAICAGLFLMGVFSCMAVQEFWPRRKAIR